MKKEKKTQVVMLATDKTAPLYLGSRLFNRVDKYNENLGKDGSVKGQHLYFLSDDEIKKGDWYIHNNKLYQCTGDWSTDIQYQISALKYNFHNSKECKKIIASTDESLGLSRPSNSFIQKYVEEYNKGNIITEVMVEYESGTYDDWIKTAEPVKDKLKTKPDNTIICSAVEETLDDIYYKLFDWFKSNEIEPNLILTIQWLKDNNYQAPKQIKS